MNKKNKPPRLKRVIDDSLKLGTDIKFKDVIELVSGCKVIPFSKKNKVHKSVLRELKNSAVSALNEINKNGIKATGSIPLGNKIEKIIMQEMHIIGLQPEGPKAANGKGQSSGYPDIIFYKDNIPYYLECKTYNSDTENSTHRTFYFSPSTNFKVIYDTIHFLISFQTYKIPRKKDYYKCSQFKIFAINFLALNVKLEFNSSNKKMYSGKDGTLLLAKITINDKSIRAGKF